VLTIKLNAIFFYRMRVVTRA